MKATFLGHAAAYLEFDNTRIVIDPFLTGNPKAGAKADDLDPDFIVVSHGHGDHVGDTLAIAKRTGATVVSTYELALWLENQGAQVSAQNHGGWCRYPFGVVKFTPAIHSSSAIGEDGNPIYLGEAAGVIIQAGGEIVLHCRDISLCPQITCMAD